jgi:hypothetical protein
MIPIPILMCCYHHSPLALTAALEEELSHASFVNIQRIDLNHFEILQLDERAA